jgi:hypothetical protein
MSRGRLNISLTIILVILILILISSVSTIDPTSSQYSIKRFKETSQVRLSFATSSKAEVLTSQLNERLNEVKFLIDSGNHDPLEKASNRYNTIAGQLIEILPNLSREEVDKIKQQINHHPQVLTNLKTKFGSQSAYLLILPQNIDTANRLLGY